MDSVKHFLAGYASGIGLVLAGHPFDTVKVRLQTDSTGQSFKGPFDCLKQTVAREGVRGLYKGVTPPLLMTGFINSCLFGMMGMCRQRKLARAGAGGAGGSAEKQTNLAVEMSCGLQTGVVLAWLVAPMEHIKTKLQVQRHAGSGSISGPVHCARQIVSVGGPRALWQGLVPTMMHRGCNFAYFGGYFVSKNWLQQRRSRTAAGEAGEPEPVRSIDAVLSGMMAGTTFWLVCYPVDVVKGIMQAQPLQRPPLQFPTVRSIVSHVYQRAGLSGFYRGFTPCLIRSLPANAAAFLCYESALKLFNVIS